MTTKSAPKDRYMFVLTSFDQTPDVTATGLILANTAASMGADVLIWLTGDAVKLAIKHAADKIKTESFSTLGDLLDGYREAGGVIGLCPSCGKARGVTNQNMETNASWMASAAVLSEMQDRQTLSF